VSKLPSATGSCSASARRSSTGRASAAAPARQLEHRVAYVDAGQAGVGRVVVEVEAGAGCDLEHVAVRGRAEPGAPAGQKAALERAHGAVVTRRGAVVDAAHALAGALLAHRSMLRRAGSAGSGAAVQVSRS
jgi:hypothetical protein